MPAVFMTCTQKILGDVPRVLSKAVTLAAWPIGNGRLAAALAIGSRHESPIWSRIAEYRW